MQFNIKVQSLIKEAKKRNFNIKIIDKKFNTLFFTKNNKIRFIARAHCSANSDAAAIIAKQKILSKKLLQKAKINTPKGILVEVKSKISLKSITDRFNFPFLIKQNDGSCGKNVYVVNNYKELQKYIKFFTENKIDFIAEEFVKGDDHRFFCIKGKIIAVAKRIPANVTGDGRSTIKQLIKIKNQDPRRGVEEKELSLMQIGIDETVKHYLKERKLNFFHVPKKNKTIYLRANANISTGGDSIDCTDIYHPNYNNIIEKIYKFIPELKIMGADILSPDITEDPEKIGYSVIEINHNPGFDIHEEPYIGKKRNIAKRILDVMFER